MLIGELVGEPDCAMNGSRGNGALWAIFQWKVEHLPVTAAAWAASCAFRAELIASYENLPGCPRRRPLETGSGGRERARCKSSEPIRWLRAGLREGARARARDFTLDWPLVCCPAVGAKQGSLLLIVPDLPCSALSERASERPTDRPTDRRLLGQRGRASASPN